MGITDSRTILARIEAEYKSLRKYCDPVYGEITVMQHKSSRRICALIEKTFPKTNSSLSPFLQQPHHEQTLLRPQNYDLCDLSLCSDIRLYFFLFEYAPHNLQQQITQRMQEGRPFQKQQALRVFGQQVEIIQMLRTKLNPQSNKPYRFTVSNSNFLCSPMLDLRVLEPVFKNYPDSFEEIDRVYLSPEAFRMSHNGENFRIRQVLNRQSSLVFTLALNFMELLLLADFSMIYQEHKDSINFDKLSIALQQIQEQYGQQIESFLTKMLQKDETSRPSLYQLKRELKGKKRIRKSISRYDRQKEHSTQIF